MKKKSKEKDPAWKKIECMYCGISPNTTRKGLKISVLSSELCQMATKSKIITFRVTEKDHAKLERMFTHRMENRLAGSKADCLLQLLEYVERRAYEQFDFSLPKAVEEQDLIGKKPTEDEQGADEEE